MASAGPFQSRPQAQKMTPKATAMIEAMTMSMVRQRWFMRYASQLLPGGDAAPRPGTSPGHGTAGERPSSLRWHYPDQVRGSAVSPALSALRAPLSVKLVREHASLHVFR